MLIDMNGNSQPHVGSEPHWLQLDLFAKHAALCSEMEAEIATMVAGLTSGTARCQIHSQQAGATILTKLGPAWKANFDATFPPHTAAGLFGMALWRHLSQHPAKWCFSSVEAAPGTFAGKVYWRC